MENEERTWDELEVSIKDCRNCVGMNITGKTQSAPGYGNKESPIVLIGQSLCNACMKTQIPFTGGSGKVLDIIFQRCKAIEEKSDIYTTNLVKCHPLHNRTSKPEEKKACTPFLVDEIRLIKPKLVIPMGADATKAFLGYRAKITELAYKPHTNGEYTLIPMFHPAYIMRQHSRIHTTAYVRRFVAFLDEWMEA